MRFLGNIIWVIFGGLLISIEYLLAGLLLMITIIGIPFGYQVMKIGGLALWPFGKRVIDKESTNDFISLLMNVIWILIGGFWIALTHIGLGLLFFITIIGIPFGKQHFKLAWLALFPFGKTYVSK